MKRIIFTYGTISGVVIITTIIASLVLSDGESTHLAGLEWLGYLTMIMAFSVIFVGIKRYRDHDLGGVIKFSTAVKVGLGIVLNASIIYVAAWEANLSISDYDFIEAYSASAIEQVRSNGGTAEEIQEITDQMSVLKEQYSNTFYRLAITFMEIFPVGLIISLISAAILRKNEVLPDHESTPSGGTS